VGVIKHEQHDYPGIDPFYSPVIAGIERACQTDGHKMLYGTAAVDELNRTTRLPPVLINNDLDGLIIVGTFLNQERAHEVRGLQCPVVLIDGYAEEARFDRVLTNNIDGAYDIVCYLVQQGHCHIGLIGTCEDSYPSIRERRDGYLKALYRAGIDETYIENSLLTRESAYNAATSLLLRCPQITAIFAANDNAAFGVINAVRSMGLEVPNDISVVGFDDIFYAQDMLPPLTTMGVDKMRMGEIAVQQLDYRAMHPSAPVMTQVLDARLIERSSVRAPKQAA
jgi:DNA-binding LacI/PurR family transcriptional regulator